MNWLNENNQLYRDILKVFNRYVTVHNRTGQVENYELSGVDLQVLEVFLTNDQEQTKMLTKAESLGMAASRFTKVVNKLTKLKLVEKYHKAGNKKDVIVVVTTEGKRVYHLSQKTASVWIHELENMLADQPERIKHYQEFIDFLNNWMDTTDKPLKSELIKLPQNDTHSKSP